MHDGKKEEKNYTYRTMRDERAYGFYWYSAVWKVLRPILMGLGVLLVVAGILLSVWNKVYSEFLAPVDAADPTPVEFTVASGQSLSRVSRNLEEAGLIRSKTVFKYYCDFSGFGQKIQSGNYVLTRDMTMEAIADRLTTGDGNALVRNITMIPGWTIEDFAAKLLADGVIKDREHFLSLCRDGRAFSDYYYIADVLATKTASQRKYVLEGYLAPNTYEIYTTATDEDIIRKLLSQTEAAFPSDFQDRIAELGFSMDQLVTMASMIEKEAKPDDFARVAAVFHNRLKAGMKLQSDVTIHYVSGVLKMDLDKKDLAIDSPYNTYKVSGLPVGPICNPSSAAIMAALYPDEGFIADNYLYFCAKDPESGELHFSRTLAEHEQAVAIYAPLWKAYDEQRGIQ
ncbi:MAG: endolytic transglycosylase MltG [Clostridia bacterium]|nr:endolytic transglycosylase MltG [Clostridia bacterium]